MADKAVNWGDSVSAVCTVVNGDTPLEIMWALNNAPIENKQAGFHGDGHPPLLVSATKRNSLLTIDSVNKEHAGAYTCIATNQAGTSSYTAQLSVNGTYEGSSESSRPNIERT